MGPADEHDEGHDADDPLEGHDDAHREPGGDRPRGAPPDRLDRLWVHPSELHPVPRRTRARMRLRTLVVPLASGLAGAVIAVLALGALGVLSDDKDPGTEQAVEQVAAGDAAVAQLVDAVAPGLVMVTVSDVNGARRASGVALRHAGEILTSARVVGESPSAVITTEDGETLDATVVGRDPTTDLALLAVDTPLQAVPLAEETLRTGESVWIVGAHPPGETNPWISSGVVSSTDSLVAELSGPTTSGLLESDALATAWSSGGALIDRTGAVAGIVLAPVGERRSAYAVPITLAIAIANDLRANGYAAHGALGVEGTDSPAGPIVTDVPPDSTAAQAGVLPNDIVLAVDGRSVLNMAELIATVRSYQPGAVVELELLRGAEPLLVEMALASTVPEAPPDPTASSQPEAAP
jgi:putative serine protease PepD